MKLIKSILPFSLILIILSSYTKKEVDKALNGTWELKSENDTLIYDTTSVQEIKIKNRKITETLYDKVGKKIIGNKAKKKGHYNYIESHSKEYLRIKFKGGYFIDEEEFYITKITPDTIHLLSYHKHGETKHYLIKK